MTCTVLLLSHKTRKTKKELNQCICMSFFTDAVTLDPAALTGLSEVYVQRMEEEWMDRSGQCTNEEVKEDTRRWKRRTAVNSVNDN